MKITTLWTSPFKKDQYFTSDDAALATTPHVRITALTGYPAVELDNGTFRLIDSDTIVAADREVTIFSCSAHLPGMFFHTVEDAYLRFRQIGGSHDGSPFRWGFHKAIPLPDGSYRRVREGDVVRLWEPEKKTTTVYEAFHSANARSGTVRTGAFFLSHADALSWARRKARCADHHHHGAIPFEAVPTACPGEYRLSCSGRVVDPRRDAKELIAEEEALIAATAAAASFGATQAAPESVEKPFEGTKCPGLFDEMRKQIENRMKDPLSTAQIVWGHGGLTAFDPATNSLFTWGAGGGLDPLTAGSGVVQGFGGKTAAVPTANTEKLWQETQAAGGVEAWMNAKTAQARTPVTATPESQANAEQDAFFSKLITGMTEEEARSSKEVMEHIRKRDERIKACVELGRQRNLRQHATALCFELKSILSLPAGPARAEAKLKLIGEISKL